MFTSSVVCKVGLPVTREPRNRPSPVLMETRDGSFSPRQDAPLQLDRHILKHIDSPDTVNAWFYGGFGAGIKYSAPTNALMITTPELPPARVGAQYTTQLESKNGQAPMNWHLCGGALPSGINLSPAGELAGTPATAATFQFTAAVTDDGRRVRRDGGIVLLWNRHSHRRLTLTHYRMQRYTKTMPFSWKRREQQNHTPVC